MQVILTIVCELALGELLVVIVWRYTLNRMFNHFYTPYTKQVLVWRGITLLALLLIPWCIILI